MGKRPRVGEPPPDFELEGTDGSFRLSAHRGERVVLLFADAFVALDSLPRAATGG